MAAEDERSADARSVNELGPAFHLNRSAALSGPLLETLAMHYTRACFYAAVCAYLMPISILVAGINYTRATTR